MAEPTKSDIFVMYVNMRQCGQAPDEVIRALTEIAYQLSREDRHALGRAVQDWEASEGTKYAGIETIVAPKPAIKPLPKSEPPTIPNPFGTKMLNPEVLATIAAPTLTPPRLC